MASAFEPSLSASMRRQSSLSSGMHRQSSLSSSMHRQSLALAAAPSIADTLPSINWGFDDLRDRMNKFSAKFDAFIEQGRKRVLEERSQFRMNVEELNGKISFGLLFFLDGSETHSV